MSAKRPADHDAEDRPAKKRKGEPAQTEKNEPAQTEETAENDNEEKDVSDAEQNEDYLEEGETLEEKESKLAEAEKENRKKDVATLAADLTSIYRDELSDYEKALQYCEKWQANPQDKEDEANAVMNMAILYERLDKPDDALIMYNTALDLAKSANSKLAELLVRINIMSALKALGQHDKIIDEGKQALVLAKVVSKEPKEPKESPQNPEEEEEENYEVIIYQNMAEAYAESKTPDRLKAGECYETALSLITEDDPLWPELVHDYLENTKIIVQTLENKTEAASHSKKGLDKAVAYITKIGHKLEGITEESDVSDKHEVIMALSILDPLFKLLGQIYEALGQKMSDKLNAQRLLVEKLLDKLDEQDEEGEGNDEERDEDEKDEEKEDEEDKED